VISGLTRREVAERFDSIVDFAELEAFIDTVRDICDEALWLDGGRLILHGRPDVVVDQYIAASDAAIKLHAAETAKGSARSNQALL